jgi:hypothetical protein
MGRLDWQEANVYGKRALVEIVMDRYKAIIGLRLRGRRWHGQQTEAAFVVTMFNRMPGAERTNLSTPQSSLHRPLRISGSAFAATSMHQPRYRVFTY